jgi:hypothetical protein
MGICFSVKSRASTTGVAGNARLTGGRSLSTGLTNGGYGGLFWVFIGTVLCYSSIVASPAEMTSMVPTRSANTFVNCILETWSHDCYNMSHHFYSLDEKDTNSLT